MQAKKSNRFPECWISWTWQQEKLLNKTLIDVRGSEVRIFEAGTLNLGNGPDIQGALLEIDGIRYRGDVEFHVDGRDWFRHGHDTDRRYQNVLLHLVWDASSAPEELNSRFAQAGMRSNLNCSESHWREVMQLLEAGQSEAESAAVKISSGELADYADRRFHRKVHRLAVWSDQLGLPDTTFISLAIMLGYSQNSAPFRQLLWKCPPTRVFRRFSPASRSPFLFWSWWCWSAGLLNHSAKSYTAAMEQSLSTFRMGGDYPILSLEDWNFSRLRPSNRPAVRLAGLAQILYDFQQPTLFEKLLEIAMERQPLKETIREWMKCLQRPLGEQLRSEVYQFCGQNVVRSIGDERARQCILNGVLPILQVWGIRNNNPGLCAYLESLYEQFPRTENPQLASNLAGQFTDEAVQKLVRQSGFYQQGALEVAALNKSAIMQPSSSTGLSLK